MHDLLDLPHLIFGYHDKQDVGGLVCVGTLPVPVGDAPAELFHDGPGNARLFCKDHNAHIDILDVNPVNGHRQDGRVYQRVDNDLYVEHEKTDRIHKDVHQNIDPAHAEAGIFLCTAEPDDILPAAGAPAPEHKTGSGARHDTADDAGRQVVVHKRGGRYGDNGEEHTLYADRDQRLYRKAPAQDSVAQVKERNIHDKVDKARQESPPNLEN